MAKLQAHYIIQLLQAFFLCEEIVIIFFTLTAFVYYIRKITNVVEVVKPDMFNISPPTSLSCCLVLDSLNSFLKDTNHYSYAAPTIYELLSNAPVLR